MRIKKVLTIARQDRAEKGIDLTRHLSGDERVSLVEDLRREMARVQGYAYPRRLRRFLEISKR
jgi:hypothetical protein